jgi:hypothetical protein
MSYIVIELNNAFQAALLKEDKYSPCLRLFQVASSGEGIYTPASSFELYGKESLIALRDALNAMFPRL